MLVHDRITGILPHFPLRNVYDCCVIFCNRRRYEPSPPYITVTPTIFVVVFMICKSAFTAIPPPPISLLIMTDSFTALVDDASPLFLCSVSCSPLLSSVVRCGIVGLQLHHREAQKGVLHCFEEIMGLAMPQFPGREVNPRAQQCGPAVEQVCELIGRQRTPDGEVYLRDFYLALCCVVRTTGERMGRCEIVVDSHERFCSGAPSILMMTWNSFWLFCTADGCRSRILAVDVDLRVCAGCWGVEQILRDHGQGLVQELVRCCAGELPSYSIDGDGGSVAGLLWRISVLCPSWLQVSSLPLFFVID